MAIAKMKLVKLNGDTDVLDSLISVCCMDGNFHPENAGNFISVTMGYSPLNEINPYTPLMQKIHELEATTNLELKILPTVDSKPLSEDMEKYLSDVGQKLSKIHADRTQLVKQKEECEAGLEKYEHFKGLDVELDKLFECEFLDVRFGHLPKESYEILQKNYGDNPYIMFFPCSSDSTDYWGMYFVPIDRAKKIDRIFASLYFERIKIPQAVGTTDCIIENLENNIELIETELKKLDEELEQYWSKESNRCDELYTKLIRYEKISEIKSYAVGNGSTFFLVGWIPEKELKNFTERVNCFDGVETEISSPKKDSKLKPPTKLKNPFFIRPYEFFVSMYGLPNYNDIDITGFVAITYTILFGIMFGDLGQGFVLSIIGFLMWKFKKMALGKILVPCGIASMFFGFMFGSVFGYEEMLNPVYKAIGWGQKPLSVMESINTILLLAIGIGVGLMFVAFLINILTCIKRKDIGNALFSQNGLAGVCVYAAGASLAYTFMSKKVLIPSSVATIMLIAGLVILFLKEILVGLVNREENWKPESISDYILQNIFELLEYVLSYLSNTVSFLRVGAFVLVHAGMMMVVFSLAGGGSNIPVVIIGNVLVIALEGLLTGIQALRLEYYEMFSKFFEGSGRPFKAIKLNEN